MIKYPTNTIQRCIDCNGSTALPVGQNGLNGEYGGYSSLWKFNSSTTPGDPNSNYLLIDSGVGSAFKIYVSTTNADGANMNGFLGSLDDNGATGNHGYLRLFKEYDSNTHKYYKLEVVQNLGAYYILEVTLIDSNNSFTNNDNIVLTFTESGIPGTSGTAGTNGTNGINGIDGIDGDYGGFSRMWKFDTDTNGAFPPNTNYLKFNSNAYPSVTSIFVNQADAVANASGFLAAIQNSGNYGMIKIFKEYDSSNYVLYNVTNWSNLGTYRIINVTYLGSNGSFTMNDKVVLTFTPRGLSYAPVSNFLFTIGILNGLTIPTNTGTALKDGDILIPFSISTETDPLNAYNGATGIWTCPANGYYDISFLVGITVGSFVGSGYVYAGLTDGNSPSASVIACSDVSTVDNTGATGPTAIQLSSAQTMRPMTFGTQLAIRLLNKTGGNISPTPGSSTHMNIKLVQTF